MKTKRKKKIFVVIGIIIAILVIFGAIRITDSVHDNKERADELATFKTEQILEIDEITDTEMSQSDKELFIDSDEIKKAKDTVNATTYNEMEQTVQEVDKLQESIIASIDQESDKVLTEIDEEIISIRESKLSGEDNTEMEALGEQKNKLFDTTSTTVDDAYARLTTLRNLQKKYNDLIESIKNS